MDFTRLKYIELCEALLESGYQSLTVADFILAREVRLRDHLVVLRHDVDRFPRCALEMAKLEGDFGLMASYYFRIPASWDKAIIKTIASLGHEVGLHYECLDKAKGDVRKAGRMFGHELSLLRELTDVVTVSMHGNPLTRFDNCKMWNHFELGQFGLRGEVYLTIDFGKVVYYSDTGRTWEEGRYNLKDRPPDGRQTVQGKPELVTTDDLIRLVKSSDRNLYLLIHPSRWPGSVGGWLFSWGSDLIINRGKVLVAALRR